MSELTRELKELVEGRGDPGLASSIVPGAGYIAGGAAGAALTIPSLIAGIRDTASPVATPKESVSLILRETPVPKVHRAKGMVSKAVPGIGGRPGTIYSPGGLNPVTLAHELGHLDPKLNPMGRFKMPAYQLAKLAPLVAIVGALGAVEKSTSGKSPEEVAQFAKRTAVASGVLASPILYEEGRANVLAIKKLRAIGMSWKDIFKKGGSLAANQLSYPAKYVIPALGLYLGAVKLKEKYGK